MEQENGFYFLGMLGLTLLVLSFISHCISCLRGDGKRIKGSILERMRNCLGFYYKDTHEVPYCYRKWFFLSFGLFRRINFCRDKHNVLMFRSVVNS